MEFLQLIQQVPAFHFYSKQKKGGGEGGTKDFILYSKTQVYWDATWSFFSQVTVPLSPTNPFRIKAELFSLGFLFQFALGIKKQNS